MQHSIAYYAFAKQVRNKIAVPHKHTDHKAVILQRIKQSAPNMTDYIQRKHKAYQPRHIADEQSSENSSAQRHCAPLMVLNDQIYDPCEQGKGQDL